MDPQEKERGDADRDENAVKSMEVSQGEDGEEGERDAVMWSEPMEDPQGKEREKADRDENVEEEEEVQMTGQGFDITIPPRRKRPRLASVDCEEKLVSEFKRYWIDLGETLWVSFHALSAMSLFLLGRFRKDSKIVLLDADLITDSRAVQQKVVVKRAVFGPYTAERALFPLLSASLIQWIFGVGSNHWILVHLFPRKGDRQLQVWCFDPQMETEDWRESREKTAKSYFRLLRDRLSKEWPEAFEGEGFYFTYSFLGLQGEDNHWDCGFFV
uniref:Ubiquitin-like protease family profile domain-containing protein n=1 Tax=Chromera velia CCMP2878 TaxID=1169474 RepID=A0A0G4HXV4_9ALVE|eukprot:Cvel_9351.t1-p1 / transcript=Cvel_9351.t1 / gene=Cvel_9351 / organism=Chromera_velia_CCMP2878 / gene_product=hypothetical protein / transcript_product=hypothetical protein / location=Cvel_scaffold537:7885-12472(+) / protein_length=270 / sequence_SO=supercontig / SO=protein_coding / is_pseudo=false